MPTKKKKCCSKITFSRLRVRGFLSASFQMWWVITSFSYVKPSKPMYLTKNRNMNQMKQCGSQLYSTCALSPWK